jgi:hypothetical protein
MMPSWFAGKVTSVRFRRLSPEAKEVRKSAQAINAEPDALGLPMQWCFCHHCGAWGWRWPPHGIDKPCPVLAQSAEAFGLKTDAERMTAVRTGLHLEEVSKLMTQAMREAGLIDDEEDES